MVVGDGVGKSTTVSVVVQKARQMVDREEIAAETQAASVHLEKLVWLESANISARLHLARPQVLRRQPLKSPGR